MTTVSASLLGELRDGLAGVLVAAGYEVEPSADIEAVLLMYFNVHCRRIPLRPRQVEWSKEIQGRNDLSADERHALSRIESASRGGLDLNPYLSTTLTNALYNDGLLNDWGIHHLHLDLPNSRPPCAAGFVGRTGPLLFVWASEETLYFLDVLRHRNRPFVDESLVEILHANWPSLIEHLRASPHIRPSRANTGINRRKARDAGLTMFTQTQDGTLYFPLGGGSMTSKVSSKVMEEVDRVLRFVHEVEIQCQARDDELRSHIRKCTGREVESVRLRISLAQDPQTAFLIIEEANTRVRVAKHVLHEGNFVKGFSALGVSSSKDQARSTRDA